MHQHVQKHPVSCQSKKDRRVDTYKLVGERRVLESLPGGAVADPMISLEMELKVPNSSAAGPARQLVRDRRFSETQRLESLYFVTSWD